MSKRRSAAGAPWMLRGSLYTLRRKCGKENCRCAAGDPHESPALSYQAGGRTKTITLAESDVAAVRAALERYRTARAELDEAAEAGIVALRAKGAARRGGKR